MNQKGYVEKIEVRDEAEVMRILAERSEDGGAWVAWAIVFSNRVRLYRFANPSSVPDRFVDGMRMWDMRGKQIGWKGRNRGFTEAAVIREQNRGVSCQ